MRVLRFAVILSSLVGMAACDRPAQQPAVDQKADLSWLDTMDLRSPVQKVDSAAALSPAENALTTTAQPTAQTAAAPVAHRATSHATTHRRSSARRSSSSGTVASNEPVYSAPRTRVVKHTRRDAVIGGAGGAVIGAIAGGGRHRVKGAVIGGVAGAIAGAVIGNNVDKSHQVQW
jgi:outer membrane lipoprotein SlyB